MRAALAEPSFEAPNPTFEEISQAGATEAAISQSVPANPAETDAAATIYKHTLEDGREFAGTREQAMKLCPVLGKMSRENAQATLEEADLAQRIAARGREKRLAQERQDQAEAARQQQSSQSQASERVAAERAAQAKRSTEKPAAQTAENLKAPSAKAAETTADLEAVINDMVVQAKRLEEEAAPDETSEAAPIAAASRPRSPKPVPAARTIAKRSERTLADLPTAPLVKPQKKNLDNQITEHKADLAIADKPVVMEGASNDIVPAVEPPATMLAEIVLEADDALETANLANLVMAVSPEADDPIGLIDLSPAVQTVPTVPGETGVTESGEPMGLMELEPVFDDETMNVFEQLLELINPAQEQAAASLLPEELYEIFTQDAVVFLDRQTAEPIGLGEANEADGPNAFEEFILAEPRPENSPDIETVIAAANQQTLEITLAQLSFCLETAGQSEAADLKTALRDVIETLPDNKVVDNTGEQAEKTVILLTPELTSKLLTLLRTAGYDNPGELLVEFIKRHDFEFLIQAIRYLHQLGDDANQQESLPIKVLQLTSIKTGGLVLAGLGQAILQACLTPKPA